MEENPRNLKSLLQRDHHPMWLSIGLHLLPGILATVVYIPLAKLFWNNNLPVIFAFYLVLGAILVPFEYGVILLISNKKTIKPQNLTEKVKFPSIIKNTKKNSVKSTILLSFLALTWILIIMGGVDKLLGVSAWIHENWFGWLPEFFDFTGVYNNPEQYSTGILVVILLLTLIFGAIIGPLVEEIYFRGYLMPRIGKNTSIAPFLNAIFFALYHLWTPWMFPMRVIGLLPMVFLVWFKKDIKIGIYSHIALNLLGDVIMVIPILFL
jgi:hypothetical protein